MRKKINPNRMELFRLRSRLVLAQRGHKLLKDKLEGLIRELDRLMRVYAPLRRQFDEDFRRTLGRFTLAGAVAPEGAVDEAIAANAGSADLPVGVRRLMGVEMPVLEAPTLPQTAAYSFTQTPAELDGALREMRKMAPSLFELAQAEWSLFVVTQELERVRRRTNALEHVLIPELQEQRRDVEQKISELERSNVSRLMKVKELLLKER